MLGQLLDLFRGYLPYYTLRLALAFVFRTIKGPLRKKKGQEMQR